MSEWFSRHGWLVPLLALVFLVGGGCGSGPKTVRVTGTVRYQDKPVANLFLTFVPTEGRSSWGVTDEHGHFKLSYDRTQEGAVPGTHKVYVAFRPRTPKQEMDLQQGQLQLPPDMQAILAKYGNEKTTPLRYEITADGQVIDMQLD